MLIPHPSFAHKVLTGPHHSQKPKPAHAGGKALIQNMVDAEFSEQEDLDKLLFSDDMEKIAEFIENYEPGF